MIRSAWWRRFLVRGVFWRQFLRFAVFNVPIWLEPVVIAWWSLFFLLWGPGRRGVMTNLGVILPGSTPTGNFFRTYRVFWNYAWTIADNVRFRELRTVPDWEFEGAEHFQQMTSDPAGAVMLTAHMGSYDLGAHLLAESTERSVVMVRAPEQDPETRSYEADREESHADGLRIDFNTRASDLALELLEAIKAGEIIAVQGDRVTEGISSMEARLFGHRTDLPAGPFALAMVSRALIYPMFVIRAGRRRYRLVAYPPISVVRSSPNRDEDLARGIAAWSVTLEEIIRVWWPQWFAFEPFMSEPER